MRRRPSTPSWPCLKASWRSSRIWRRHFSQGFANTPIVLKLLTIWTEWSTHPSTSWPRPGTALASLTVTSRRKSWRLWNCGWLRSSCGRRMPRRIRKSSRCTRCRSWPQGTLFCYVLFREVEYLECASFIEIYWSLVSLPLLRTSTIFLCLKAHNILTLCRCRWIWCLFWNG